MKKIILLFSLMVIVVATTAYAAFPAQAADDGYMEWGGIAATSFAGGDGSENNPFLITTPGQLKYMCDLILSGRYNSSCFRLGKDIYYNDISNADSWDDKNAPKYEWTPMGKKGALFQGGFDGAGHTIYGLYCSSPGTAGVGFIGLSKYGTVTNLTIDKSYFSGGSGTGAIMARANDGVDIINCVNYATVVANNAAVGGILGGSDQSNIDGNGITVKNCVNYGKIVSNVSGMGLAYAGGIVGYIANGGIRMEIANCVNYGDIDVKASASGGILGGVAALGEGLNPIVSCINFGSVSGAFNIGGIVGMGMGTEILMCENHGDVTGQNCVGGIAGISVGLEASVFAPYERSINLGTVKGDVSVGGIIGLARRTSLLECANLGDVNGGDTTGGIVGQASDGSSDQHGVAVKNCYNAASVSGTAKVGGIIGYAKVHTNKQGVNVIPTFEFCINTGVLSDGAAEFANGDAAFLPQLSGGVSLTDGAISDKRLFAAGFNASVWGITGDHPFLLNIPLELQGAVDAELMSAPDVSVRYDRADRALGLKVSTTVNKSGLYSEDVTYGTLIIPTELITAAGLNVAEASALDIPAVWMSDENKSSLTFNGVLTNIPEDEYYTSLTVRSYAKIPTGDGYVYVYSEAVEVAYAIVASEIKADNDALAAIKNTILAKTDDLSIKVGSSAQIIVDIKATSFPALTYTSSNPGVATVDKNGKVTAVGAGEAKITVNVVCGDGSKSLEVNVNTYTPYSGDVVIANDLAPNDNNFRILANSIKFNYGTISKNDGFLFSYNGTVILCDGGNYNDYMLNNILEIREAYIRAAGLGDAEVASTDYKIEIISILSHYHGDHYGSLISNIFASPYIKVSETYLPVRQSEDRSNVISYYDTMYRHQPDVKLITINYGEVTTVSYENGAITIDVMGSVINWKNHISDATAWQNANSIWTRVSCNGRSMLLTGDTYDDTADFGTPTYKNSIAAMCEYYSNYKGKNYLDVDFVKPAHHGRICDSSPIFEVATAEYAIINAVFNLDCSVSSDTAAKYGDLYYTGDSRLVFDIDAKGNVTVVEGMPRTLQNDDGVLVIDPNYYYKNYR